MCDDRMVSTILDDVRNITQKTLEDLLDKWHSMYVVNDEIKLQRFNQFVAHIKDFYDEMLLSEEKRKNCYKKEVEKKLKECKDLEKALHTTISCDIDCSVTPLTEVIKHLDNALKNYEELKFERIAKLENLRNKENTLCKMLGFKELNLTSSIPSDEDIERLEHHIFILEEEKIKRMEVFISCRNNIIELINKLEVSTLLDFEKTLVESDAACSLTSHDLDQMKNVEASYKQNFEAAKVKIEYMFEELTKLWNRLDIDEGYRQNFMEKHPGVGRKTVENIQREIHRCEKLKRELIEPLIKKTRCQILDLCNKLCYSEEQCAQYMSNDKNHYSEDVLDVLEIELGKLDFLYNENCEILETAKKHRDLWERMLELEEAAKDKSRLFNNRGGQLLREEKERKTIEQSLPKLHKKLEELLVDYELKKSTPFLYFGENLLQKIQHDLEQRNINRQNKPVKKNENKQITDSATKVREKRKMNGLLTPKSENGKRLKLTSSTLSLASSASKNSNKSIDGRCGSRSRIALFKDQDTSVASSYSIFQEEIEEKKRSLTICDPERQPLKDVNSPALLFHSSPSQEMATPRFNLRSNASQFNASRMKMNASTAKSAIPTSMTKNKKTPMKFIATPATKNTFATPKTVTKSVGRTATPKYVSSALQTPAGNTPKTRNFFETPKTCPRSSQKTLSIIKPAKFKFNF